MVIGVINKLSYLGGLTLYYYIVQVCLHQYLGFSDDDIVPNRLNNGCPGEFIHQQQVPDRHLDRATDLRRVECGAWVSMDYFDPELGFPFRAAKPDQHDLVVQAT